MKKQVRNFIFFLFLAWGHFQEAQTPSLTLADVHRTMNELFHYHVEYHALSPLLVRRALKLYLEQFDAAKSYLLEKEVNVFLDLTPQQLHSIVDAYQRGDFSIFLRLNQTIERSIKRAKFLREEIEREQILHPSNYQRASGESYLSYANDESELKQRLRKQLIRCLNEEAERHQMLQPTMEERKKIFQLWERRFHRKEETYLTDDPKNGPLKKIPAEHYYVQHILKSLAKSLDVHTCYFTPEEAQELRFSLEKHFEGIGVILRESIDGVVIADLVKGSPAEKSSQIEIGDLLVEIDGQSLEQLSYEEILDQLKPNGKKQIQLAFKRKTLSKESIFRVELIREKILLEDERLQVSAEPYGEGIIGKLTLPSFYESSHFSSADRDMREAIKQLKSQGKLLGLIIDLRGNSGGFLTQAVKVSGLFIPRGVIVISKYARGEMKYLREINGKSCFEGPLIVLTSKLSASASEIVAGALQDYGVALIVGDERTYGKGTIQLQTVTDPSAKVFFKVTVGRYYTASGKSTQLDGVKADIVVPSELAYYNVGERFLEYPLAGDQVTPAFNDLLHDIDQKDLSWFQKNYLPYLKKPVSTWKKLLPLLAKNSELRLENDKNFNLFLEHLKQKPSPYTLQNKENVELPWGDEDLQMVEAVNILKEIVLLHPSSS